MSTNHTATLNEAQIGYAETCVATLKVDVRKEAAAPSSPSEKWFAANQAELKQLALDNARSLCGQDTLPVTDC